MLGRWGVGGALADLIAVGDGDWHILLINSSIITNDGKKRWFTVYPSTDDKHTKVQQISKKQTKKKKVNMTGK